MQNHYNFGMSACHSCAADLSTVGRIYRNTTCPNCGAEVKVCLNCEFYTPGAHWECRESIPEEVRDKDRANFCDYFRLSATPKPNVLDAGGKRQAKKDSARSSFDQLFGNE